MRHEIGGADMTAVVIEAVGGSAKPVEDLRATVS